MNMIVGSVSGIGKGGNSGIVPPYMGGSPVPKPPKEAKR